MLRHRPSCRPLSCPPRVRPRRSGRIRGRDSYRVRCAVPAGIPAMTVEADARTAADAA
jgi:hypothetical protein